MYMYDCIIILDLNECILNTDKCAHHCINTLGSYSCSCETGYKLSSNGLHCDGKLLNSTD